jgi:thioesterase-3
MTITKVRVYGFQLDMYGHVNNARYLEFLETARWEFIERKMTLSDLEKLGIAFVVVNININYRRPAFLGQELEIHSAMTQISGKSAHMHQKIYQSDTQKLIVDADIKFVIIDNNTQKVVPITGKYRDIIEIFKS